MPIFAVSPQKVLTVNSENSGVTGQMSPKSYVMRRNSFYLIF